MFKVEIKVKLDFAKIRVYIVHKMDGSIVKYTKYLKCESKHNNVRSIVVSRCGVCSKVLGSNPSACAIFSFYGYISIGNLGWCGPSGAGLRRRPYEKKKFASAKFQLTTWAGVGRVELGCVGLRKKKVCVGCKVSGSIPQRLSHFFLNY